MNIIKRIKAPTPSKYKKWGKLTRDIALSLAAGTAATVAIQFPPVITYIIGGMTFLATTISTFCFAQVEGTVK